MSRRSKPPAHGRGANRRPRHKAKRYLVVSGGEITETQYFEYQKRLLNIEIVSHSKARAPAQLVDFALRLKREQERDPGVELYDRIWVVVDVDDFHDHREAERKCSGNGIELVISNPCFETWLIDHICPCPDSYVLTKDVERYAAEKGVTTGKNHKYIEFNAIDGRLDNALKNVDRHNTAARYQARRRLVPRREQDFAPWTDMATVMCVLRK